MGQAFDDARTEANGALRDALKSRADDVVMDFTELKKDVAKLAAAVGKAAQAQAASARHRVSDVGHSLRDQADDRIEYFGERVRERPLAALGVTLGVGLVLGVIMSARR